MSKKKAFSGNTMTLKDFHGGSIPSDISLPSAPGVVARPADRPVFDRQNAWGNTMGGGRSDHHRLRPSSSGSMRNLDDNKTPFVVTSTVNIGRNFDEDERKPLDGGSFRRTVSDESFGVSSRVDVGKVQQQGVGSVVPQSGGSYSAKVVEGGQFGGGGGGGGSGAGSARPNAWGVRKEVSGVGEIGLNQWNGQSAVSKFAQASALDQISSGRWQTKPVQQQVDVEVIRPLESPNGLYGKENDAYVGGVNVMSEREYYDAAMLTRHLERGLVVEEGIRGGFKEMPGVERVHSPVQSSVLFTNEGQPAHPDGKCMGAELQQPSELTERPKLKLLPRSKPLDVQEATNVDHRPGFQQQIDISCSESGGMHGNGSHVKPRQQSANTSYSEAGVIHGNGSPVKPIPSINEPSHVKSRPSSSEARQVKPGVSVADAAHRVVERPKLNLKPRTQPVENLEGSTEKERMALFGGARPREMVLKERGVDDVTSQDEAQVPSRTKNDSPREVAPAHPNTSRQGERVDNLSVDQRTGRGHEKKDQRADIQRVDTQKKNWRNDTWRSGRDTEKHQQERQPSPETWRKPVEQPNADNSGLRFGKAVSAVDLAQAFSRSVSGPKPIDQYSGQRGLTGQKGLPVRSQIPFSRLTGPTPRPQNNGY